MRTPFGKGIIEHSHGNLNTISCFENKLILSATKSYRKIERKISEQE